MKFIYIYLSLFIIPGITLAQKNAIICGKIISSQSFAITICAPVNGYHNSSFIDTLSTNNTLVNSKDSIYKAIELNGPTFVDIRFKNSKNVFINRTDVLLFPGDSINVRFNLEIDNPNWVVFNGSNAAGQKLFNEINYMPYNKFKPVFEALNSLPDSRQSFIKKINDAVNSNTQKFKDLKNLSDQFLQAIDICFRMLFYQQVINKLTAGYSQAEGISKAERDSIVDDLIVQMKSDVNIKGLYNSSLYLNNYYNYLTYKKYQLNSIDVLYEKDKVFFHNGQNYIINKNLAPMLYVDDSVMQQDLWAINILNYINLGIPDYELLVNQYCSIFPTNKWEKLLKQALKKHFALADVSYKLQSPVVYVNDSKKITQLSVLLKELPPNSPVFIDCWASWCLPCVNAFAFNKSLDSLLLTNKIVKLYISIDDPGNRENWEKAITKYCLGGYHIMANQQLITDIKKVCNIPDPEKSPIMIPRYLFVNKKGVVIINNAISPDDFEQLKNQILGNTSSE